MLTTLSAACGRQHAVTGAPPSNSAGGGPSPGITHSATSPRHPAAPSARTLDWQKFPGYP
ncbi:hypothetical protein ACFU9Y_04355 [Streptomyces sp. NPDC057621]|uniref:hypothetical protein n=1 Tax=Streptomyces sp. NPDC057621 TaxID=3346186 RepID=UPI0036CBB42A